MLANHIYQLMYMSISHVLEIWRGYGGDVHLRQFQQLMSVIPLEVTYNNPPLFITTSYSNSFKVLVCVRVAFSRSPCLVGAWFCEAEL